MRASFLDTYPCTNDGVVPVFLLLLDWAATRLATAMLTATVAGPLVVVIAGEVLAVEGIRRKPETTLCSLVLLLLVSDEDERDVNEALEDCPSRETAETPAGASGWLLGGRLSLDRPCCCLLALPLLRRSRLRWQTICKQR